MENESENVKVKVQGIKIGHQEYEYLKKIRESRGGSLSGALIFLLKFRARYQTKEELDEEINWRLANTSKKKKMIQLKNREYQSQMLQLKNAKQCSMDEVILDLIEFRRKFIQKKTNEPTN